MKDKEKKPRNKEARWLTAISAILVLGGVAATIYIWLGQKYDKERSYIYQDGQKLDKLDADITIIPGSKQSYDLRLRSYMGGSYNVYVTLEGTSNKLTDLVKCEISNKSSTGNLTLTQHFNQKDEFVCWTYLDNDNDSLFNVTYEFDESIDASTITPIDVTLSFKISRI